MRVLDLPVLPNQIAPVRIVAGVPFTYASTAKTEAERERRLASLPPIYRLDMAPLDRFEGAARLLLANLAAFEAAHPDPSTLFFDRHGALTALADDFNARGPYETSADDLEAILAAGDQAARAAMFENGFGALRQIYARASTTPRQRGRRRTHRHVRDQAAGRRRGLAPAPVDGGRLTFLRVSLAAEGVPRPAVNALFRLFSGGVQSNLVFDRDAAAAREAEVIGNLRPVVRSGWRPGRSSSRRATA